MRVSLPDNQGLVWAFRLGPTEACGCEVLADDGQANGTWLHFNLNDARARRWLELHAALPEDALALFLEAEPRTCLRAFPQAVALVVSDMHHDFDHRALDADAAGFSALRVYVDARRIITARRHPLKSVDMLRRELPRMLHEGAPVEVLECFLERMADLFGETVSALGLEVDGAEDRILAGRFQDQASVLSRGRRLLARLRRQVGANSAALGPTPDAMAGFCAPEHRARVAQSVARLGSLAQEIDFVQERSRLLQEEITNHLSETTNRNLYLLSIVTTALLPITLITGIFGMNVGGMPWSESRHGFTWVMLGILVTVVGTLIALRRRGPR